MEPGHPFSLLGLAPGAGLEPATHWLTANCSTTELSRNIYPGSQNESTQSTLTAGVQGLLYRLDGFVATESAH